MPPNPQNLRPPWKPGESGNPDGYSRGRRFTDRLLKLIDERGSDDQIAEMWHREVLAGNFAFFREMLDRAEGKVAPAEAPPPQVIEVRYADETIRRDLAAPASGAADDPSPEAEV